MRCCWMSRVTSAATCRRVVGWRKLLAGIPPGAYASIKDPARQLLRRGRFAEGRLCTFEALDGIERLLLVRLPLLQGVFSTLKHPVEHCGVVERGLLVNMGDQVA